jgi:hypothetical protein
MTERPAFLQRVVTLYPAEVEQRRQLLQRLFTSSSAAEVRQIVAARPFDYLLVYPDKVPATDLACCLKLLRRGTPQVYELAPPD